MPTSPQDTVRPTGSSDPRSPRRNPRRLGFLAAGLVALALLLELTLLGASARSGWMPALPPDMLARIHRRFPHDSATSYSLALQRYRAGDLVTSSNLLRETVRRHPGYLQAASLYSLVLTDQKLDSSAYAMTERVLARRADLAPALVARGRLHLKKDDLLKARQHADAAIAVDGDEPTAWQLLAEVQQIQEDWSESRRSAERAVALAPTLWYSWLMKSRAETEAGAALDAQASARRAVALRAQEWTPHIALGNALLLDKEKAAAAGALDAFDQALKRAPLDQDAHLGRAEALVRLGRTHEAEPILTRIARRAPRLNRARALLASLAESRGDRRAAQRWRGQATTWAGLLTRERELRREIWGQPYPYYQRYELARVYARMGLRERALNELAEVFKGGPVPGARELYEELTEAGRERDPAL